MAQSAANIDYQDFDPFFEWSEDEASATLTVMLPGFTKEQLTVQVTSTPVLRINGERQIFENKRRRFSKDFSIPPYCDTNDVSAKLDGGVLRVKFPKLITPAKTRPQPQQAPMPQKEKETAEKDDIDKQELPQKEKEPTSDEKEENKKREESAEKENEPIGDVKEKDNKTEEKVAPEEFAQKKVSETAQEGITTKGEERAKQKMTQRLKTRVLDFTVSLRSGEDHQDGVKQGFCVAKSATLIKRPKIWFNIVVAILLVMVLGLYVKNAFRSSHGGSDQFQEF